MVDLASRSPCGPSNHLVHRHSQCQKLAHNVQHVFHASIHASDMKVTRDRVREKALLNSGHDNPPGKAAAAVPYVEDHTAFPALDHSSVHLAGGIDLVAETRIA